MRLIDGDKLLESLLQDKITSGMQKARFLDLVRAAPTVGKDTTVPSKWISVKERLPDDASDVLAYYDDGTESRIILVNYYKRCWYDCIFNRPIDDMETGFIGYWMPLPEPPKEEKHNG